MMKYFWSILIIIFALISCKSDDDSLQRIDQVMNIYMKNSAGQDLLNSKKAGSYTGYSVNDLLGDKDVSPVSMPLKVTTDSLFYLEYIAGAKRIKLDSVSPENPGTGNLYVSRMQLTLSKKVDDETETTVDELEIHYRNTPTAFQVSEVLYNKELVFSKEADTPNSINTVTIVK